MRICFRELGPSSPACAAARSQLTLLAEKFMPIGTPTQLFINGKFVNSVSGKTFVTHNPANETVCASRSAGRASN